MCGLQDGPNLWLCGLQSFTDVLMLSTPRASYDGIPVPASCQHVPSSDTFAVHHDLLSQKLAVRQTLLLKKEIPPIYLLTFPENENILSTFFKKYLHIKQRVLIPIILSYFFNS